VTTSEIGNLTLPIPAGTLNAALNDPTAAGLLDFLAFNLQTDLNDKLSNLQGTSFDACPTENRFLFDPSMYFVREGIPALYAWWDGGSVLRERSLVYMMRERKISVLYVFDELVAPGGMTARNGLIPAVDACFAKAADRGQDPAYGYNGDPLGTTLSDSLNLIGWYYNGGTRGFMAAIPASSAREGLGAGDGMISRGYPSLSASFTVLERIVDDVVTTSLGESTLGIDTGDDPADTFTIMQRLLP
jgi:hypothetical protein